MKVQKIFGILMIFLILICLQQKVQANEKQNSSTQINGATIKWEYELNETNEVEKLKCLNPTALTGILTIPSQIDGKTVVSIADSGFENSTNVTELILPKTVKTIGLWAFSDCNKLTKVDLGSIEKLSQDSFKNCTALTKIKLPKTLTKAAGGAPFSGCTNLKTIELEEGMTIIPDNVCAKTPITEIALPKTVKTIGLWAFSDCNKLTKVDLGSIEKLSQNSFENCTALTKIKLPKTLTKAAGGAPFSGCTNLKTIELEEGMTIIPDNVCAQTPITEIALPKTVKTIGLWAFENCMELNKITILDTVEEMQGYLSGKTDEIFKNHSENLTIYCYMDSLADKYAKKYNIKTVYLKKQGAISDDKTEEEKTNEMGNKLKNTTGNNSINDVSKAPGEIPQTGLQFNYILCIAVVIGIAMVWGYNKYCGYKDVK